MTPDFIQLHHGDDRALAAEAAAGLRAPAAHVSPKFFYDSLGSRLFDAITETAEYYPTRTEAALMATHGLAIGEAARRVTGPGPALVDLGAGNCAKASRLFPLLQPGRYVAVDISVEFLRQSLQCLQREHPQMPMVGVGLDFSAELALPPGLVSGPAVVFYPGSSIGNFTPAEALHLLSQARSVAAGGALLIGADLVKPVDVLEAAYDDALGITAAFNLNLLNHLNRLLGADFQLREWRHLAVFNAAESRIEMHLEARRSLTVRWPGAERRFAAGERIHTENSYKWNPQAFEALLRGAGFTQTEAWTDAQGWFGVWLAWG
ncbi:MAG: L-histidine N(alpha)-methyltransferase [Rubrivivax sp.]|jgi:dimethylhistidine N-methyltransferase|nr:L-histidine N(alpha)-methyltransferase [Rubrivivax sp.]